MNTVQIGDFCIAAIERLKNENAQLKAFVRWRNPASEFPESRQTVIMKIRTAGRRGVSYTQATYNRKGWSCSRPDTELLGWRPL